jgi:hypothetical protein
LLCVDIGCGPSCQLVTNFVFLQLGAIVKVSVGAFVHGMSRNTVLEA